MTNPRCAVALWSTAPRRALAQDLADALPPWADLLSDRGQAFADPKSALAAAARNGTDVIVLEDGVTLPALALQRLRRAAEASPESSVVSAVRPSWVDTQWPVVDADSALWWCLPRQVFSCRKINLSCSYWRQGASVNLLDPQTSASTAGSPSAVCSHLMAGPEIDGDSTTPSATHGDSNNQPAASPLEGLASQLWSITDQSAPLQFPLAGLDNKPVVLHVLHGWGGGTARWVSDVANAWHGVHHLFLLSYANPGSETQGQELRLYAGNLDSPCLQRWALPEPIVASTGSHREYQDVLRAVLNHYQVDSLIVSSLIGHSVQALETGLPTLCMLHDYYPAWPDLGVAFEHPQSDFSAKQLPAALSRSPFQTATPTNWMALQTRWLKALKQPSVVVFAPSNTVAKNLTRVLSEAMPDIHTVNHGLAEFRHQRKSTGSFPGKRLRLLVPGRISKLKGAAVLRDALPELTRHADVYLLGGGKHAESFYALNHVHIVLQYDREELPELLDQIKPDLALLLSTASETFNYTLSEMWALDVPVLATRVGALEERIEHNKTGLLIEPNSAALAKAIAGLTPDRLNALRQQPKPQMSLHQSTAAYAARLRLPDHQPLRYPITTPGAQELARVADFHQLRKTTLEVRQLRLAVKNQQTEIERRAQWATEQSRRADQAVQWAQSLELQTQDTQDALADLQAEFDDRTAWALELNEATEEQAQHIDTLSEALDDTAGKLDFVFSTMSWKMTRPLRVAARLVGRGLNQLGLQSRRANGLQHRARNSLRIRGVKGTIRRVGQELKRGEPDIAPKILANIDTEAPFEVLEFPSVENPLVSIVIPTYNHFNHTQACLKSLTSHRTEVPFEVIVVDDCSNDETRERLAEHSGLVVIHNEENRGFIDTCNAGAATAKGKYLFFLNNDTVVADKCLDHLVDTFSAFPNCGLAGAKLVYPDGRLQEAGGIVFSDGSGWNYGRFENPAAPEVNFVREVDYCSGAAILIQRQLFNQLGGFDQRYRPAYYEDTDLAFQVREEGLQVLYQPAAQVVHFEGITSGTDTASGVKKFQLVNQEKFVERWGAALEKQPDPQAELDLNRRHRRRRSVLIIDACTPTPDQDSGSVRMVNLMQLLLNLGWHVRFMAENRSFDDQYTINLQQLGIEVLYHPFIRSARSYLKSVGSQLDAVILSRHYIASNHIEAVRSYCPNAQLIFDTVDLHYLREQRLAELENNASLANAARKTRTRELDVARRCDLTLVVSEFEKAFLATDAADLKVSVLSNIHPVHGCRKPYEERSGLLFVGGFQHPPNVDGITWFVRDVLPLVHQQLPDLTVTVIGSKINDAVRSLAGTGVNVLGFVEDIEPHLDGARLSLAPLRYGAGVKGKINMAMSYGQPVVATGPAVEGMHVEAGRDVMVGDTPEQFAEAVIKAYTDKTLWETLSACGLKNVEHHFSFEAARQALRDILED
ncbi:MAG: glycosyltransferase [Lysobacterales bacterium]